MRTRCLVTIIPLLAAGCASDPDPTSGEHIRSDLVESLAGQEQVRGLRARFALRAHAGQARPLASVPGIGPGSIRSLRVDGDDLIPSFRDSGSASRGLEIQLPRHAGGWTRVTDSTSRMGVRFRIARGASPANAKLGDGLVLYEHGAPGGGSIVVRATSTVVEDYLVFEQAPERSEITYDVQLGRVAGLRLVANTLEFLDELGTPRLRVPPPYLVDSAGKRVHADLRVSGCEVERSPVAPWGRVPTAPGAEDCTLHVSWINGDVKYPALLDPSWSTTGEMIAPRIGHAATVLADGRVVVAGAAPPGNAGFPTELFDPATETWAATSAPWYRFGSGMITLDDGRALIIGGDCGTDCNDLTFHAAEVFDPATGSWDDVSTPKLWSNVLPVRLKNGDVLVAGGCLTLLPETCSGGTSDFSSRAS